MFYLEDCSTVVRQVVSFRIVVHCHVVETCWFTTVHSFHNGGRTAAFFFCTENLFSALFEHYTLQLNLKIAQ